MGIRDVAVAAQEASRLLAQAETEQKNEVLQRMVEKLEGRTADLIQANEADRAEAAEKQLPSNLVDRLRFDEAKINGRIRSLKKLEALPDPVGRVIRHDRRPNGLDVERVAVPLGVILMVYEARPHVTVNAGAFCLKSGNASILRGGSEARRCNALLGELWAKSLLEADLPPQAVQVTSCSHDEVRDLLQMEDCINLVIPRGGKELIQAVARDSRIPVIKHYEGICHVYLDEAADLERGIRIAIDSKCLMPAVCNASETLLVHEAISPDLPRIIGALREQGVRIKGGPGVRVAVRDVEPATEEDWRTEYLDLIYAVRVVEDVAEAISHVNRYGSHHTDTIVTENREHAQQFVREVDSGVVLVNASTMFCDGESLGMGAEIGISTDKIHARGPMGLEELTSYKFVIRGDGHVMGE